MLGSIGRLASSSMPASPISASGFMTISSHASATSTPCPLIVRGMYATVLTAASSRAGQIIGQRQRPREIGPFAVAGRRRLWRPARESAPAGAAPPRAVGERALSWLTARWMLLLMCASALPVSGSRTRISRPSPSSAGRGIALRFCVVGRFVASAAGRPQPLAASRRLRGLAAGASRLPGRWPMPHNSSAANHAHETTRRMHERAIRKCSGHVLQQSLIRPSRRQPWSRATVSRLSCQSRHARKIIETSSELGKRLAEVAVVFQLTRTIVIAAVRLAADMIICTLYRSEPA